jgi:hypothetical protein
MPGFKKRKKFFSDNMHNNSPEYKNVKENKTLREIKEENLSSTTSLQGMSPPQTAGKLVH